MDLLFELIVELLIEGGVEISSNKKISKWIRYPILAFLILLFSIVVFGMLFLGIFILRETILAGIIVIVIALVMLIGGIVKFRVAYIKSKHLE